MGSEKKSSNDSAIQEKLLRLAQTDAIDSAFNKKPATRSPSTGKVKNPNQVPIPSRGHDRRKSRSRSRNTRNIPQRNRRSNSRNRSSSKTTKQSKQSHHRSRSNSRRRDQRSSSRGRRQKSRSPKDQSVNKEEE